MRTGFTVHLSPTDRKRLRAIVDDRNSPRAHPTTAAYSRRSSIISRVCSPDP